MNIILLSLYSNNTLLTAQFSTPLIFETEQIKGFDDLLKFDDDEINELVTSYEQHYPEAEKFKITEPILNLKVTSHDLKASSVSEVKWRTKKEVTVKEVLEEFLKKFFFYFQKQCEDALKSINKILDESYRKKLGK